MKTFKRLLVLQISFWSSALTRGIASLFKCIFQAQNLCQVNELIVNSQMQFEIKILKTYQRWYVICYEVFSSWPLSGSIWLHWVRFSSYPIHPSFLLFLFLLLPRVLFRVNWFLQSEMKNHAWPINFNNLPIHKISIFMLYTCTYIHPMSYEFI